MTHSHVKATQAMPDGKKEKGGQDDDRRENVWIQWWGFLISGLLGPKGVSPRVKVQTRTYNEAGHQQHDELLLCVTFDLLSDTVELLSDRQIVVSEEVDSSHTADFSGWSGGSKSFRATNFSAPCGI